MALATPRLERPGEAFSASPRLQRGQLTLPHPLGPVELPRISSRGGPQSASPGSFSARGFSKRVKEPGLFSSPPSTVRTFGSEVRFKREDAGLFLAHFDPGPADYNLCNVGAVGMTSPDSNHRSISNVTLGKRNGGERDRSRCMIKLSSADYDKPLAEAIQSTLARNAVRVIDLFREWDTNGNGNVGRDEFRIAIKRMGFEVSDADADKVFDSWDDEGKDELSLQKLWTILRRRAGTIPSVQKSVEQLEVQRAFEAKRRAIKHAAKLKHVMSLTMRKPSAAQERLLQELAGKFDSNPNLFRDWEASQGEEYEKGWVLRTGFRRMLRQIHVTAEKEEALAFYDMLDPVGEGRVGLGRLEASLRWVVKSRRTTLVRGKQIIFRSEKQLHDRIGDAFRVNAERVMDLFNECDQNRDGLLSRAEFRQSLPILGLIISAEEADKLFDLFDRNCSGAITLAEFRRILTNGNISMKRESGIPSDERLADLDRVRAEVLDACTRLKITPSPFQLSEPSVRPHGSFDLKSPNLRSGSFSWQRGMPQTQH